MWNSIEKITSMSTITLRMFGGYISIIGASMENETQVISISFLISQINKVWKLFSISY